MYIACRSKERAEDAISRLTKEVPDSASKLVYLPFDLTDLASAKSAAKVVQDKESRLDIFSAGALQYHSRLPLMMKLFPVANAGVMAWPHEIKNGVEVQFWNHLGHFALVDQLLPLMKKTAREPGSRVRIVNVASLGKRSKSDIRPSGPALTFPASLAAHQVTRLLPSQTSPLSTQ